MADIAEQNGSLVAQAVHRAPLASKEGLAERLFTLAFRGLVYPQIWEDPEVDMKALRLGPGKRIVTIASGGCNALSYLTADPEEITAVDLNPAHVALVKLKLAALRHLPTYELLWRFLGSAAEKTNIATYRRFLRQHLDADTLRYFETRSLFSGSRLKLFTGNLYRHGLFGRFIGFAHLVCRIYGVDPRKMLAARDLAEQRRFFEEEMAPLFDRRFVRWATSKPAALYGLGIPPAQYEALAGAGGKDGMAGVLKERLRRLATAFPLSQNYFAWQAFGRAYAANGAGPLPPFLQRQNFEALRQRAGRLKVVHRAFTDHLALEAAGSLDGYVLLDAQDWMTDRQLNALWSEITRTARPGARAIFRTAAEPSLLPGRVAPEILGRWRADAEASRAGQAADRSATYGGFHVIVFQG